MHDALRAPLPEDRRSDLAKDGKNQVSVMNWVKDIQAEVKTRGLDAMFCIDQNIRTAHQLAHRPAFASVFAHFGRFSIKDTEDYVANITRHGGGGNIDADAFDKDSLCIGGVLIRESLGASSSERARRFVP